MIEDKTLQPSLFDQTDGHGMIGEYGSSLSHAEHVAFLTNILSPKAKFASIIGSYGWATKVVDKIAGMIPNLKVEVLPLVVCKGHPIESVFDELDVLANAIAAKHQENNFGQPVRMGVKVD